MAHYQNPSAWQIALDKIQQACITGATELDLSHLRLRSIPAEITCLAEQLTVLKLKQCAGLFDISSLAGLSKLQELDLSRNENIIGISSLAKLIELEILKLSGCDNLTDLRPLNSLSKLQQLDLSGCKSLTDLRPLNSLNNLQQLDLSECKSLTELHPLNSLSKLQWLDLSWCKSLTEFSPLNSLSNLQQLHLSRCDNLTDLRPLNSLSNLQQLDLSGCDNLTDLRPLNSLSNLGQLNVSWCNKLTELSPLNSLSNLQQLDLSWCKGLTELSSLNTLSSFTYLRGLDLRFCDTISLPSFDALFQGFPYLKSIALFNTKLKIDNTPIELTKNLHRLIALEDYYFALQTSGAIEVKQQKLMVLGNGRIGKTQLTRRLQNLPYDDSIASTHGIHVQTWQDNKGTHIHSWDFGGQDIYLGTHALFLDDRAVYCLLWHPDFENENKFKDGDVPLKNHRLSYWLAYIDSIAGKEAPVIVCQSQCDTASMYQKPPMPQQDFTYLHTTEISAKRNDLECFVPLLNKAIRYQNERIGKRKLPKCWWAVAEVLIKLKQAQQQLVSYRDYQILCEKHQVSAPESLLTYLHRSGIVFYKHGLFDNQLILDQAWALKGVYSLLERGTTLPALQQQQGRFTQALLRSLLWSQEEYTTEEQTLFLSMMQQCGVCFKIDEHTYIAPDSLPEKSALTEQAIASTIRGAEINIHVSLNYAFLHEGTQRSILSAIGEQAGQHATYWRYGCCYYDTQHNTAILLECSRRHDLSEDELAYHGHPGQLELKLYGRHASLLAEHLIESILTSHQLGKRPEVIWHKGEHTNKEDNMNEQDHAPYSQLGPAADISENKPEVYFSYAWGEEQDRHQQVCDALYQHAKTFTNPKRDRENTTTGDSIYAFEEKIGKAEIIVVILSDKYLKSHHCMRELNFIYKRALNSKDEFNKRICPFVLPPIKAEESPQGVTIDSDEDRLDYAIYWKQKLDSLETKVAILGPEGAGQSASNALREIREFQNYVADMLSWLSDQIISRDPQQFEQTLKALIQAKYKKD